MGEALLEKEIGIEDGILIDTGTILSLQVFITVWIEVDMKLVIENAYLVFLLICFLTLLVLDVSWPLGLNPQFNHNFLIFILM